MNIRPRGERTWELVWQDGRDPETGKWRREYQTFHGTEKQAQLRWAQHQQEIQERGARNRELKGITIRELWELWLEAKTDIEPSTRLNYQQMAENHLLPVLGRARVEELTALDVQRALTRWRTAARKDGKEGTLSPRSVNYCRSLLVAILDQALQWQLVPTNVAKVVKGPRQRKALHREDQWWTVAQAQQFLAVARTDRQAIAFRIALGTALREGEILALRWEDIDWTQATLTVRRTQKRTEEGYVVGTPKTAASRRTIPLDEALMQALQEHRATQNAQRDFLGEDYDDHALVVCTALGTRLNPSNLRRSLKRLCEQAGVPLIRFHDLRHTHASWLVEQGVDERTVANRLGHTNVAFTYQTYVHSRLDRQRDAAEQLGARLWGISPPEDPE